MRPAGHLERVGDLEAAPRSGVPSFVPSVLVCISICMIPTGMCLQACEFTTLAGHWLWPALYRAPRYGSAARATLPARRRTSHGSGCPPTLAGPAAALGAALWGKDTRRDRRVRVTRNTRRVGAYGRSGWSSSGRRRATRRDSNRGRGIGRLDETMSPVARGRVLSRIMIWRFLGIIAYLAQPKPAKAKLKSGPTTTNLNMARLRRGPRPARWPRKRRV